MRKIISLGMAFLLNGIAIPARADPFDLNIYQIRAFMPLMTALKTVNLASGNCGYEIVDSRTYFGELAIAEFDQKTIEYNPAMARRVLGEVIENYVTEQLQYNREDFCLAVRVTRAKMIAINMQAGNPT